jgi:predicted metal-binding protein
MEPVELLACETCGGAERSTHGSARGERLLGLLKSASETRSETQISVSSVRCMWLCKRPCAMHIRGGQRAGYLLAELEASAEVANALLDYAVLYRNSSDGAVPYREWPQALRGHFVCRVPVSAPPVSTAAALSPNEVREEPT